MHRSLRAKVVFVGDSGVGKTSLILRHDGRSFSTEYSATLGANFVVSTVPVAHECVELQVWDTAGQERFRSMVPMYLRNAKAAFLVFDMTSRETFDHLTEWIQDLNRWSTDPIPLVILGNKADLKEIRVVSAEEAKELASQHNAAYYETSAVQNTGITTAMATVAERLLLNHRGRTGQTVTASTVDISNNTDKEKKKKCCS